MKSFHLFFLLSALSASTISFGHDRKKFDERLVEAFKQLAGENVALSADAVVLDLEDKKGTRIGKISPLKNYLEIEYRNLNEIYSDEELDHVFTSMEVVLKGKSGSLADQILAELGFDSEGLARKFQHLKLSAEQKTELVEELLSGPRHKFHFDKTSTSAAQAVFRHASRISETCEANRRQALLAYMVREYEMNQRFDPESADSRKNSMRRLYSELNEAFDASELGVDPRELASYDVVVAQIGGAATSYSQVSVSREVVDSDVAAEQLHNFLVNCKTPDKEKIGWVLWELQKTFAQTEWTDENRRNILQEILFSESTAKKQIDRVIKKHLPRKLIIDSKLEHDAPGVEKSIRRQSSLELKRSFPEQIHEINPDTIKNLMETFINDPKHREVLESNLSDK